MSDVEIEKHLLAYFSLQDTLSEEAALFLSRQVSFNGRMVVSERDGQQYTSYQKRVAGLGFGRLFSSERQVGRLNSA